MDLSTLKILAARPKTEITLEQLKLDPWEHAKVGETQWVPLDNAEASKICTSNCQLWTTFIGEYAYYIHDPFETILEINIDPDTKRLAATSEWRKIVTWLKGLHSVPAN